MVEDELIIAMELESLLRRLGWTVIALAPTVTQALQALDRERPDVAVLDVNLRGEWATPVAEDLTPPRVPLVLVTGHRRENFGRPMEQMCRAIRQIATEYRDVRVIYQSMEGLRSAIPGHAGDWYFTGHYPTPGGNRVVNQAFINYYEKNEGRSY